MLAAYRFRALADSTDRETWLTARQGKIGASDAAGFAKLESAEGYARAKLKSGTFAGNAYTEHGNARERFILSQIGIPHNTVLFHAADNPRHVATPDGIREFSGGLLLAEAKTTNKPFAKIPPAYLRQIFWAQYVLGAEKTVFAWEVHVGFIPTDMAPRSVIVERDDAAIKKLVQIADAVLDHLDDAAQFLELTQ